MRSTSLLIAVAWSTLGSLAADTAPARECADPVQAAACASNAECRCGANTLSAACQAGAPECIDADGPCRNFCGGFEPIGVVCRDAQCVRALATSCVGDCDADTRVDVDELVTAVGVALDQQPIAACDAVDADRDQHVTVDELITAVGAALDGCGAVLDATASGRRLYDGWVTFEVPDRAGHALGTVSESSFGTSLTLQIYPNAAIHLSAAPNTDMLTLDGYYLFTDIAVPITGSARVRQEPTAEVIEGDLAASGVTLGDTPSHFIMWRSTALDPRRFAGRWDITFDRSPGGEAGPSHTSISLDIGSQGSALSGDAPNVSGDGTRLGTITSGECQIAPGGHLFCAAVCLFDADRPSNPLRLTGWLAFQREDGWSGRGQFLAGVDPPFDLYVFGGWTARRVETPAP